MKSISYYDWDGYSFLPFGGTYVVILSITKFYFKISFSWNCYREVSLFVME